MATTYPVPTGAYRTAPYPYVVYDSALLLGRIVLVAMFIFSGFDKLADLPGTAAMIAGKGLPMPTVLAVVAGLAELVGGLLIVIGWQTRLAALGLLVFTLTAAYFFHDFWAMPEGPERMNNMIHAMKNLSIAGSFLMLAGVGAGRFSIDGRKSI
jgi:putative oxidoreductase